VAGRASGEKYEEMAYLQEEERATTSQPPEMAREMNEEYMYVSGVAAVWASGEEGRG